jgi:hypothetical protein
MGKTFLPAQYTPRQLFKYYEKEIHFTIRLLSSANPNGPVFGPGRRLSGADGL